ncbi:MAG TPA: alpha/beta hydrolase [Chloroflexi bacterium]|nr:alpha/beta hydrolase [Chloroflexota bacterium]
MSASLTSPPLSQRRARWRRPLSIIGLTAVLLIFGIFYLVAIGKFAQAQLVEQSPPPGRFVDVGGYHLHIDCRGPIVVGEPTLVLEAGLGESSLTWAGMMPLLAAQHRVCAYDRAGYGWSDSRPTAPTAATTAADLYTLLQRSGEAGPYVLVGHSLGAIYVRFFAHQHPDVVAGMVLLDPSHEEMTTRLPVEWQQRLAAANQEAVAALQLPIALIDLGVAAVLPALAPPADARLPLEAQAHQRALLRMNSRSLRALAAEIAASEAILAEARTARLGDLGDRPLVVVSADHVNVAPVEGVTAPEPASNLHEELAKLSRRGLQITVRKSSHYVHYDQPVQVADAIEWVMKQIQL